MQAEASTATENSLRALTLSNLTQLLGAMLIGTMIIFGAGFLNTAAAHNAAHDTRHSQGFPCH